MFTVSELAKQFSVSRSSILYYERMGLFDAHSRSDSDYRLYGEAQVAILKKILAYRAYGLPLAKIKILLTQASPTTQKQLLNEQFYALDKTISQLRQQQQAIVHCLQSNELLEEDILSKDRWVDIMRAAGFSEDDMLNWHKQFEAMEPEAHQAFLESLKIGADEIEKIRERSQN